VKNGKQNPPQIPDMKAAVCATASQNGFVMRRPLNLEDFILVRLERMQFQLQVAQIPQSDRLKQQFIYYSI
jgi:hypothetical protein